MYLYLEGSNSNRKMRFLAIIIILIYPAILFFSLEILNPGSYSETINIFGLKFSNPFPISPYSEVMESFPKFLIYIIFLYLFMALFYFLFNSIFISGITIGLICYIFYTINYIRQSISGWVLAPSDFSLISQLDNILGFSTIKIDRKIVIVGIVIFINFILLFFAEQILKEKIKIYNRKKRMIMFSIMLVLVLIALFSRTCQRIIFRAIDIEYITYKTSQNTIYNENGVLLGFYLLTQEDNVRDILLNPKKYSGELRFGLDTFEGQNDKRIDMIGDPRFELDYSNEYINNIVNDISENIKPATNKKNDIEKPNVIVIMSEAFWDPTRLENIKFSKDPIPVYHDLMKTETYGNIITPAFGGGTCYPEFEFLTGNLMYFAGSGDNPYEMMDTYILENDYRSIPNVFKNNGYKTVGIHTYKGSFFNRNKIYPKLGFDEFISREKMKNTYKRGDFISDEYFTDQIIEKIEETEEPLFLYGISMENHFSYYPSKYEKLTISSKSQDNRLTRFQEKCMSAYLQGVYNADKELGRLIKYIENIEEPTILFFFGDHLPIIGDSAFEMYLALDYVSTDNLGKWNLEEKYAMHSTPYVLWANYDLPKYDWGDMSSFFIGPLLIDLANLNQNVYTSFLRDTYDKFKAFRCGLYIDSNYDIYDVPTMQHAVVIDYLYYLQYDYTKGRNNTAKQFAMKDLSKMIEN